MSVVCGSVASGLVQLGQDIPQLLVSYGRLGALAQSGGQLGGQQVLAEYLVTAVNIRGQIG